MTNPRQVRGLLGRIAAIAACLLIVLGNRPAQAQDVDRNIVVVEVAPDSSEIDTEALRAAIAAELGILAVMSTDPRRSARTGTIRVHVDRAKGELQVEYLAGPRAIARRVPLPAEREATLQSAVFLAGNLARNEARELTAWLKPSPPAAERGPPALIPAVEPKRYWLGIGVELDIMNMREDLHHGVCPSSNLGYYCTDDDGNDTAGAPGFFYAVPGGIDIMNARFLLSASYLASNNWLVGVRAGVAVNRYPGNQAPQYPTLGRWHLEGRATYLFGEQRFSADIVRPYMLFALGASQYDTTATLGSPYVHVQAWRVYGPLFGSFGFGFRWPISPRTAVMATPAEVTLAFPSETALAWSPELAVELGF
jgi:hypothetical protein